MEHVLNGFKVVFQLDQPNMNPKNKRLKWALKVTLIGHVLCDEAALKNPTFCSNMVKSH